MSNLTTGQFKINGLTVIYDNSDLDREDFSSQSVSNGQFVEVHGFAVSSTMVDAMRIELEKRFTDTNFLNNQNNTRTEDIAISTNGLSFTTRLGLNITPSSRSRIEDETIKNDKNLSIGDFLGNVSGKRVAGRGFSLNKNTVWTRLEISKKNDRDCRLRGAVSNITGTPSSFSFSIEGIKIDTSQVSNNHFQSASGQIIGRASFFNNLALGKIVQAKSDKSGSGCTNGQLTAREVEFELASGK